MRTVESMNHEYEDSIRSLAKVVRNRTDQIFDRIIALPDSVERDDVHTSIIYISHSIEAILKYTQPFRQHKTGELALSEDIVKQQIENLDNSLGLVELKLLKIEATV